ncbi:MAG TPA: RsmF rRNA methyltransferase first C-terminal domain-containing protein [Anaerolineales bacterium]
MSHKTQRTLGKKDSLAPARLPAALPPAFLERMQRLLGNEYPEFFDSYAQPPTSGLRVNSLKLSAQDFQSLSPFSLQPVPWCPAGFMIGGQPAAAGYPAPGKHHYHAAGLYYLQDPSAMAAAELLAPQPGERVLDLSAAPGGKATHLAALLQQQGLLIANEVHPRRVWELAENLERWGVRNVVITNENPERLAGPWKGFFDRVLLDAPCSGEGMFRKSEVARLEWSPELVESCAVRQMRILNAAARMVRSGGLLVYSTCTFSPQEDEAVIARFMVDSWEAEGLKFEVVQAPQLPGFAPGRPDWAEDPNSTVPGLEGTARLWPHHLAGEGHFVAVLRRVDFTGADEKQPVAAARPRASSSGSSLPRQALQLYLDFCQENLNRVPAEDGLHLEGSYLYHLPQGLPDLVGLHVIHPGWWLGEIKKGRFEPSQALAMGLTAADARRMVRLDAASQEAAAYVRGETLESPGEDGWALVTVDGFPIGWGKRVQGRIKNYYPHGLRRA